MKSINWATPLVTVIKDNTPTPIHQPQQEFQPFIPANKPILKPSRVTPFPFVDEIDDPTPHHQHQQLTQLQRTSKDKNKAWVIILDVLRFLFTNRAITYLTNALVAFIGVTAIGALHLIFSMTKMLLEVDYSLVIEFFLLLNPACDHSAITTGTTNSFSKRRR
ncbi:hypothetical protein Cantr_05388 [Candida viswanathii]|uniref:Uncharacterized protein n=1 Tax=Candida viswanathii TaxID=5486 RepID=A0A367XRP7_9ASCO|nr:hypothetical protein Cantr_05388 [Candida viswanathii]